MLCPDIANNNKGAVLRAAVSRALKSPPWACFLACEAGLSRQLAGGKGSGFLCLSHSHSSHFLGSQSSDKPWPNSPSPLGSMSPRLGSSASTCGGGDGRPPLRSVPPPQQGQGAHVVLWLTACPSSRPPHPHVEVEGVLGEPLGLEVGFQAKG